MDSMKALSKATKTLAENEKCAVCGGGGPLTVTTRGKLACNRCTEIALDGRLKDNCSKADELAHWQMFLNTLPSHSYLAQYFRDSVPMLEDAMRNDMSIEPVKVLRSNYLEALRSEGEALSRKKTAQDELAKVQREVHYAREDLRKYRDELKDLRDAAIKLAEQVGSAHQRAVNSMVESLQREGRS